ncbi:glycerophosphodiester phosphodiesterase family protein [Lysinibacter sp. HNR]|uniref:glycerophosphodiester phosphodiesterase family protein n=1 Tax=Lysinibacter sp. HNR TaxID=3031408 RepID=UPI0024353586|nr:glycerophosphodiester phosphodiesterase family protein [Lysinibacter sp. HNR]WGD36225.1 glycerophosphodiester phosphodiesterase family protein [Lysinibacter sp. HNR]
MTAPMHDSDEPGFFADPLPRIFAHRGFANGVPENTLASIQAAAQTGPIIIETDVRGTRDSVSVLIHNEHILCRNGDERHKHLVAINSLLWSDLRTRELMPGHSVPSLKQALLQFPLLRFNIDVKDAKAAVNTARSIADAKAWDRVLLTSFSRARRRTTVSALRRFSPGIDPRSIAQGAAPSEVLILMLAAALNCDLIIKRMSREISAVQIPERFGVRILTPKFIRKLHAFGIKIHVWHVNDSSTMTRLMAMGVDGIVTDRPDIAHKVLPDN